MTTNPTPTTQPILQARNLVKRYGHVTALAGADLTCALDPLRPLHPGRAALVVAGRVARVQVALP